MASLTDIADLSEEVTIRGTIITVKGIDATGIAYLLDKFPDIRKLMSHRAEDVTAEALIQLAPEALAAVIASGVGKTGDVETEKVALSLTIGEQFLIINPLLRLTFPQGAGPFVEQLAALFQGVAGGASGWGRDTRSPEPLHS